MTQMIVANSSNMVALDGMTAKRMSVIAQRTGNDFLAVSKAMLIETLKAKLGNGIAHFMYLKKDGSLREAWGTTSPNIAKAMTNGNGVSRENFKTTAYLDVQAGSPDMWRSFRWENLVAVF